MEHVSRTLGGVVVTCLLALEIVAAKFVTHDRCEDDAVTDRLSDDELRLLKAVDGEFLADVSDGYTRIRRSDRAQPCLEDVVMDPENERESKGEREGKGEGRGERESGNKK